MGKLTRDEREFIRTGIRQGVSDEDILKKYSGRLTKANLAYLKKSSGPKGKTIPPRKLREQNASLAADATPDIEQDPFLQKLLQKRAELQRAIDAVDGVIALCRKEKPV